MVATTFSCSPSSAAEAAVDGTLAILPFLQLPIRFHIGNVVRIVEIDVILIVGIIVGIPADTISDVATIDTRYYLQSFLNLIAVPAILDAALFFVCCLTRFAQTICRVLSAAPTINYLSHSLFPFYIFYCGKTTKSTILQVEFVA
jgi:hypothetical protein